MASRLYPLNPNKSSGFPAKRLNESLFGVGDVISNGILYGTSGIRKDAEIMPGDYSAYSSSSINMMIGNRTYLVPANTTTYISIPSTETFGMGFVEVATSPSTQFNISTVPNALGWRGPAYGNGVFVAIAVNSTTSVYSTNGITWTEKTLPVNATWAYITYGNNKFLAISESGTFETTIASSTNGITWQLNSFDTVGATNINISYANNLFFLNTLNDINNYKPSLFLKKSTDGLNWTNATLPLRAYWWKVIYGNGKYFVAGPGSPTPVTSAAITTNGITWQSVDFPPIYLDTFAPVVYGNSTYVSAQGNEAIYSTDAITWSLATLPISRYWYKVSFGNGSFLASGYYQDAARSTNGIDWTTVNLPTNDGGQLIHYVNNLFIGIPGAQTTNSVYSTDGITWSITNFPADDFWYAPVYGGTTYVSTGSLGSNAASSTNGINWSLRTLPVSGNWSQPVYGGTTFISIEGNSTSAASSTNGVTWTLRTLPNVTGQWSYQTQPEYGAGVFLSILSAGTNTTTAASSTNGITWNLRTLPNAGQDYNFLKFSNSLFFIASEGVTTAATSTNGTTWTIRTTPLNLKFSLGSFANTNFIFSPLPTYTTTYAALSTDAITWTLTTTPHLTNAANYYAYGDGKFVGVLNNTSESSYSTDGITWSLSTLPEIAQWRNITYGNGIFMVMTEGSSSAASSTDGITWTLRTLPVSASWLDIIYGNGKFIALSNYTTSATYASASIPTSPIEFGLYKKAGTTY